MVACQVKIIRFVMRHILVPTDFSDASRNAYRFAREMAKQLQLPIRLVHCYLPEVDPAFPYLGINSKEFLAGRSERLWRFSESLSNGATDNETITGVSVHAEITPGPPTREIVRLGEAPDVAMIVMGSTGEHGMAGQLLGSVSTHVARKAPCPVLLIPQEATFRGFRHVLFSSSYESVEEHILEQVKTLIKQFRSAIHFVHIRETGEQNDYEDVEEHIFDFFFAGKEPGFAVHMHTIDADRVTEGISHYAAEHDIDLIMMVAPRRSFWESLLHRSKTRAMALHPQLPLLIYHVR